MPVKTKAARAARKTAPANPGENLKSLLRRQGYAAVPPEFHWCPDQQARYERETGGKVSVAEHFGFAHRGAPGIGGRPHPGVDWTTFHPGGLKPGTRINPEFGIAHEPGSEAAKHMSHMRHPLEPADSLEQIQSFPWPDYSDLAEATAACARGVAEIKAQGWLPMVTMGCTVWEIAWYIRGMETLMMDMVEESERASWLLDKTTDIACRRIAAYAAAGVEWIHLGDDVGMQHSLMMSGEMYREWLKPRLARVIAAGRAVKPDLIISYHSCGHVTPLIPDFIEVGIDVLNPLQPESMDRAELQAEYGDRLSFWGGIGTQSVFPHGTPAEVKREVWAMLDAAGPRGGALPAPTHMIEPEVPWENILAYVEACGEYSAAGR